MPSRWSASAIVVALWLVFVAAVYLPDIGRGFVKDDFTWIAAARDTIAAPSHLLHPDEPGFYRPAVTATFLADYALHGFNARPYGFLNLALYLACTVALVLLLRVIGLGTIPALLGGLVWALNPHGINMAVVWISGRTSLLLTLFALLAAIAFMRDRPGIGGALLFGALLSKEEALALPVVLVWWMNTLRPGRSPTRREAIALALPVIAYLVLRFRTPAFTPWNAPAFYRPTTDLGRLAANAAEYLDRGASFAAAAGLLAAAVYRRLPLRTVDRPLASAGAVWFVLGFALTIWIPVRSSLYVVFPSVGSALLFGVWVAAARRRDPEAWRRDTVFASALACVVLFVPIYRSRNDRWVEPARLSARLVRRLQQADFPDRGIIVFEDQPGTYANFRNALGDVATEAVQTVTGRDLQAQVVDPQRYSAAPDAAVRCRLTNGRIDFLQK